jgi:hypothetical protein
MTVATNSTVKTFGKAGGGIILRPRQFRDPGIYL